MASLPPHEAPMTHEIAPISSSICKNVPSNFGSLAAMISAISEAGVMGYPAKNLQPAASAPSAQASFPCQNLTTCSPADIFMAP